MPALAMVMALLGVVRHTLAGHLEADHLVADRLHRLVGRELERGAHQVAVEDHVQVLVRGYASEQLLGEGQPVARPVLRCAIRVASSWNET